jgi:hypothetical protein
VQDPDFKPHTAKKKKKDKLENQLLGPSGLESCRYRAKDMKGKTG